jgi:hypothetical protein
VSLNQIKVKNFVDLNKEELFVPKLNHFSTKSFDLFEVFVDKYKNTLKSIELGNNYFDKCVEKLSKVKKLEFLSFRIIGQEEDIYKEYSQQHMTRMANECKLIKRIKLKTFHFKFEYLAKMLKTMHSFRQLNCLEIIESYNSFYLFPDSYFKIDLLNGCQKLTHLTIIYNNIETKIFEDIHLYLLQLTHWKITTNKTTITQNFLVNMNKLKVIRIKGKKLFRNSINLSQYHYRSNE